MSKNKRDINKSTLITVLAMSIIAAIIIFSYYYIQTTTKPLFPNMSGDKSEAQILIEKDLELAYPATPREVMRLFLRVTKCLYNDDLTEEEIESLVSKLREINDEELLEINTLENQIIILKEEIDEFKEENKKLSNYSIEESESIVYWTKDGRDYASVLVSSTFTKSKELIKVYEDFTLRRDEDGKWKILGWSLSDNDSLDR